MSVVNLRTGLMWKGRRKPVSLMIFYHNTWNPPVFRGSILFQEGLETDLMQQLLTPGWKQSSNLSQQPLCRKIGSRDPCMYKPLQPQSMNGAVNTQFCKEDIGSRGLEILPWTSHACDRYWRTNYGNRKWLDSRNCCTTRIIRDGLAFFCCLATLTWDEFQNGHAIGVVFSPVLPVSHSYWCNSYQNRPRTGASTLVSLDSQKTAQILQKCAQKSHMFCHQHSLVSMIQWLLACNAHLTMALHDMILNGFYLNTKMRIWFSLEKQTCWLWMWGLVWIYKGR